MDPISMFDVFQNPPMRHAALVHLPIALSVLGVLLVLLSAFLGERSRAIAWTAMGAYIILAGAAYLAQWSGDQAHDALGAMSPAVQELLEEHESMAEKVWIFAAIIAVVLIVSSVTSGRVRIIAAVVGLLAGGFTAVWVAETAHHGGTMVYAHGTGTTGRPAAVSPQPDDGEEPDLNPDGAAEAAPPDDPRLAHFREHIRPVLVETCIKCHNPTRRRRSADLDQTTMASILAGGVSGPAVVPGDPEASWIIKAIRHEEDLEMPPNRDKLPAEVIAAFEQWVRDGAVWEPLGVGETQAGPDAADE